MKNEDLKLKFFVPLWLVMLCGCAFGLTADLNNDSTVNQFDLQIFCEQWLDEPGTPSADFDSSNFVDFKDFVILADEWQGHLVYYEPPEPPYQNIAPTANDISVSAVAYVSKTLSLQGSDSDSYPNPPGRLKYIITQLPADVNAKVGGTKSGEQSPIRQADVPYKLSSWGSQVVFATTTTGSTSFKYKAFDGNLYSDEKTVSIAVTANPNDCLSFDGSGFVTVPDTGNYFDFEPARAVGICFATHQMTCPAIALKWEQGKNGWKFGLINGHIVVDIYSATAGKVATISSYFRYDTGGWTNCVFGYNDANNRLELAVGSGNVYGTSTWYEESEAWENEYGVALPAGSYANDCNVIIGSNYRGEIDGIRSIDWTLTWSRSIAAVQMRETAGNAEAYVPASFARFKCDYDSINNTTNQIYDDISATHLIGAVSSSANVKYLPFVWFYPLDSAAYQQVIR